eukprot:COSAG01_NODE_1524_length_10019_cov_6.258367_14_plen_172_part_00
MTHPIGDTHIYVHVSAVNPTMRSSSKRNADKTVLRVRNATYWFFISHPVINSATSITCWMAKPCSESSRAEPPPTPGAPAVAIGLRVAPAATAVATGGAAGTCTWNMSPGLTPSGTVKVRFWPLATMVTLRAVHGHDQDERSVRAANSTLVGERGEVLVHGADRGAPLSGA